MTEIVLRHGAFPDEDPADQRLSSDAEVFGGVLDTVVNPATALAAGLYLEYPVLLMHNAADRGGYIGTVDPAFMSWCYNVAQQDVKSDLSRLILGSSSATASIKNVVPWDGVSTPRTNTTREGIDF